jgi:hypothetical protein
MDTLFLFRLGVLAFGCISGYMVYVAYKSVRSEGLRPFGFMCDKCTGKHNSDGSLYYRCLIKPRILKFLGVDVDQKETERIEPEWFLG